MGIKTDGPWVEIIYKERREDPSESSGPPDFFEWTTGKWRRSSTSVKWYIIENHASKAAAVRRENLLVEVIDIVTPYALQGLAFPENEKERVLQFLGLSNLCQESPTDRAGVYLLTDKRPTAYLESLGKGNLSSGSWDVLSPILNHYAQLLQKDIFVSIPHGKSSPPSQDPNKLFIRFWSAPEGAETHRPILSACGIVLETSQRDGCSYSTVGKPIVDSNGTIVAEYYKSTLYVLFDLTHGLNADRLMRSIMELYIEQRQGGLSRKAKKEMKEQREKEATAAIERNKDLYIKECRRRIDNQLKNASVDIASADADLGDAQKKIVDAIRKRNEALEILSRGEEISEEQTERFAKEYENLTKFPKVTKIEIKPSLISVWTDQVFIRSEEVTYDIGCFRIEINTKSSTVRIFNTTNPVGGYQHPHIAGNGNPCFGNITKEVGKLLGEAEYVILIQLLINYLGSYNAPSAYNRVYNWPEAKKSIVEKITKKVTKRVTEGVS